MTTFLLFLAAAILAEPKQVQVNTLDGQSATGTLVELNGQQVVVEVGDVKQTFKAGQVRMIVPAPEKAVRVAGQTLQFAAASDRLAGNDQWQPDSRRRILGRRRTRPNSSWPMAVP